MAEVSVSEFDSDYTRALKIASASGVLVSHMRRLPDGEYEVWDNEFLSEPYSDSWLDLQYDHLSPLYPDVSLESYIWYLVDFWTELDRGLYETLDDALPSINTFLRTHNQREYTSVQALQSERAYRARSDSRAIEAQAQDIETLNYYQNYLVGIKPYDSTPLVLSSEQYTMTFTVKDVWALIQSARTSEDMPWVLSTSVQGLDEPVLRTIERIPPAAMQLMPAAPLPPLHLWVAVQQERGGYLLLDLDLRRGATTVDIPMGIEAFLARLAVFLPGIQWGIPQRLSVKGEYILKNLTLSEFALAELVTSDPLLSAYMTLNEFDPAPLRGKTRIGALWSKSRFILYFKQLQSNEKALHALFNQSLSGVNDPHGMPPGTPYIRTTLFKGPSEESVKLFYNVFNRLITYYTQQAPTVLNEYEELLGPNKFGELEVRKSERLARQEEQVTRNERLRMALPDVFVQGYARVCQAPFQPEIVSKDDDAPEGRQVLPYPAPPQNKLDLVCPENAPYPTLLPNTLESKGVIGYLPCCTTTNQMESATSAYTKIYKEGKEITEAFPPIKTRTTLQSEERILDYNRSGKLVPLINSVVQSATATRLGSLDSPSNFLLAVLQSLGATPAEVTPASLDALRRALPLPHPELLSQEMWDVPKDERLAWYRDPSRYLDPQLFIRALEHAYDINIYMFSSEEGVPVVMLPRYFQFPCRPFRARKCALIYVHAEEKRCELIVDESHRSWDENTNQRLYSLNELLCTTELRMEAGVFTNPQNVYPWYRHATQATHQILDPYGKLQGLVFQTFGATLLGPPGAPLSLPAWPSQEAYPVSGMVERIQELMEGLVPTRVLPDRVEYDYPRGVTMRWPTTARPVSSLERMATQQTTTALLLQCSNLLFYLHVKGELQEDVIAAWVENACVVRPNVEYTPTLSTPYLPPFASAEDALDYLESLIPTFFDEGRLVLPNSVFKQRLIEHLKRFVRMYRADTLTTPNVLVGGTLRLPVGTTDRLWLGAEVDIARVRPRPMDAEVVTSLPVALLARGQPVVMRQEARLYLVVPKLADIDTALVIADNWRTTQRVLTLGVNPIPTSYTLLELTDTRTWRVKERVGKDETPVRVLSYDRTGWAAILPL
jgi:hypothetical protein